MAAGILLEGLAAAIRDGQVSLDFLDEPVFDRFSTRGGVTFTQLSERTGVPVELLTLIREAAGSSPPLPGDHVREGELPYADFIQTQVAAGFDPIAVQRLLRVHGDSLRRIAETEVAWFRSEVVMPARAAGKRPDEIFGLELAHRLNVLVEPAMLELYRLIQAGTWTAVIIEGLEMQLAAAGLHIRLEHPPAMCFLHITGSTRLTQERGDAVAADFATKLARFVERTSMRHGGRPVKWLGDGVMLYYKEPGPRRGRPRDDGGRNRGGAAAAARRPPRGAGDLPEGDYYGQTVNVASRIADYARPGELLVSQEVVDASSGADVAFREIGLVELKGVAGAMRLHTASGPRLSESPATRVILGPCRSRVQTAN